MNVTSQQITNEVSATIKPLDLLSYWRTVGTTVMIEVCNESGSSFDYFRMLAYRIKPCTPKMFNRFEAAIKELTPHLNIDYVLCTKQLSTEKIKLLRAKGRLERLRTKIQTKAEKLDASIKSVELLIAE